MANLLHNDFWGLPLGSGGSHGSYRPLTVLTFRLTALVGGGARPGWFHAGNAALHAVATWLVHQLARRLLPRRRPGGSGPPPRSRWAAGTALLFAVHPVHCEAVAGVVGRADLLACIFALATLLSYINTESNVKSTKIGKTYQPTTAQGCRPETEKNILEDLFSSALSQFKKYHPSGNLKFNDLGIF